MADWVVIATGQSLKQDDVDYVKGKAKVVAVSNAYELAPWADALVSHDRAWWMAHPGALEFQGVRLCKMHMEGTHRYHPMDLPQGCNSGLMGMWYAKEQGATRIILLGFDMHGTHYFGPHKGLKNTPPRRFQQHMRQFTRFSGPSVYNATQGSALTCYPNVALREIL